jgi:hypothetical protein
MAGMSITSNRNPALKLALEQLSLSVVNSKRAILPSSLAQKHNLSYSIVTTYNEKIGAENSEKIHQEKKLNSMQFVLIPSHSKYIEHPSSQCS